MSTELAPSPRLPLYRPAPEALGPVSKIYQTLKVTASLAADRRQFDDPFLRANLEARRFFEVSRKVVQVHGVALSVQGELPTRPGFWVCNHRSYLDPLIVGTLGPVAVIAKQEVASWPLVGSGARKMGTFFVKRGDPMSGFRALREAIRRYREGVSVLSFPEGTTCAGELGSFHRGIFGIARRLGAPIYPMYLDLPPEMNWVGDASFVPHYLRFIQRAQTEATLTVLPAIQPTLEDTVEDLVLGVRQSLQLIENKAHRLRESLNRQGQEAQLGSCACLITTTDALQMTKWLRFGTACPNR